MNELAQSSVLSAAAACFEEFRKRVAFFVPDRNLKKSFGKKIDNLARLVSQIARNKLADINRISSNLLCDLRRTAEPNVGALPAWRKVWRKNRIPIDEIVGEIVTE